MFVQFFNINLLRFAWKTVKTKNSMGGVDSVQDKMDIVLPNTWKKYTNC
ncbi:MAG: hypothetical protein LBC89_02665 [Bacteroidales bacterium]|nr:hypothetical protein [Bacteroidales bacterium]